MVQTPHDLWRYQFLNLFHNLAGRHSQAMAWFSLAFASACFCQYHAQGDKLMSENLVLFVFVECGPFFICQLHQSIWTFICIEHKYLYIKHTSFKLDRKNKHFFSPLFRQQPRTTLILAKFTKKFWFTSSLCMITEYSVIMQRLLVQGRCNTGEDVLIKSIIARS